MDMRGSGQQGLTCPARLRGQVLPAPVWDLHFLCCDLTDPDFVLGSAPSAVSAAPFTSLC